MGQPGHDFKSICGILRAGGVLEFQEYYDLFRDPAQNENLLADSDPNNDPDPRVVAGLSRQLAQDTRYAAARCP